MYYFLVIANESNIQETCCSKIFIVAFRQYLALQTAIVVILIVGLSYGLFRWSLYANLGLKVEFST